jgi:hypothetical protein
LEQAAAAAADGSCACACTSGGGGPRPVAVLHVGDYNRRGIDARDARENLDQRQLPILSERRSREAVELDGAFRALVAQVEFENKRLKRRGSSYYNIES